MIIRLKNKDTLIADDFKFKCCIGKNKLKKNKVEGDYATPNGRFILESLYYRKERLARPKTNLKIYEIKKKIGWCTDINSNLYNKKFIINKKLKHEKLFRKDYKYDFLIVTSYNRKKIIKNKGSAIFIHLTKDYKPTAGCIALNKKDFLILLKIIKKNTKIIID